MDEDDAVAFALLEVGGATEHAEGQPARPKMAASPANQGTSRPANG